MRPEEREELLTAYALGTLSEPDAAVVRDLVRSDSAAAEELAEYHAIVDMIALSAPLRHADPALRSRVLQAARRERAVGQTPARRFRRRSLLPWAVSAAVVALVLAWGVALEREMQTMNANYAALTSVVEADAKRIEALLMMGGDLSSQVLKLELDSVTADLQLALAVSTAPDQRSSVVFPTDAGHGAAGQFLWSDQLGVGWLTAHSLPPLPLGDVYQVWLGDSERLVAASTFSPDDLGRAEVVVKPQNPLRPLRIIVAVAPDGGSREIGSPTVLDGLLEP